MEMENERPSDPSNESSWIVEKELTNKRLEIIYLKLLNESERFSFICTVAGLNIAGYSMNGNNIPTKNKWIKYKQKLKLLE